MRLNQVKKHIMPSYSTLWTRNSSLCLYSLIEVVIDFKWSVWIFCVIILWVKIAPVIFSIDRVS